MNFKQGPRCYFFKRFILFMCLGVLPANVSVYNVGAWSLYPLEQQLGWL